MPGMHVVRMPNVRLSALFVISWRSVPGMLSPSWVLTLLTSRAISTRTSCSQQHFPPRAKQRNLVFLCGGEFLSWVETLHSPVNRKMKCAGGNDLRWNELWISLKKKEKTHPFFSSPPCNFLLVLPSSIFVSAHLLLYTLRDIGNSAVMKIAPLFSHVVTPSICPHSWKHGKMKEIMDEARECMQHSHLSRCKATPQASNYKLVCEGNSSTEHGSSRWKNKVFSSDYRDCVWGGRTKDEFPSVNMLFLRVSWHGRVCISGGINELPAGVAIQRERIQSFFYGCSNEKEKNRTTDREEDSQADNYPGLNDWERGGNSGKNNELETFQFAFFSSIKENMRWL